MKNYKSLTALLYLFFLIFSSCENGENIDKEKPEIDLTIKNAFPLNCDTLYFGRAFELKVLLTDNAALGSFSIDIHNNFDHHSHSTEVTTCNMEPIKNPVNPFVFINDFTIPAALTEFETKLNITIPSGNSSGLFDEGDYHFFISLTDKEGWSTQKGLSIKMLHR